MARKLFIFTLLFTASFFRLNGQDISIVAPGAEMQVISADFAFTEGPAVDSEGNVYFTDQPNDRIWKYSVDGRLTLFLEGTGRANGMYFDRDGRLLACADMDNELWSIDMDGTYEVWFSGNDGPKLNGPNDLWVHPDGRIYFTDPLYVRDYWERDPAMQQDGEHVYYISSDRKDIGRVGEDLVKPNGIVGTPDGKLLYVADIGAGNTYVYNIGAGDILTCKRLFAPMGSDGMTIDELGNVYLTGNGVTVFNPHGEQIAHIPVDAAWTANVCFGGKDMKTLFITASEYLYSLRMNVRGVR